MTNPWSELAAALSAAPNLPGALCKGRSELFDGYDPASGETRDDATYRHAAAAALCRRCPEREPCRSYSWKAFPSPLTAVVGGRVPSRNRPSEKAAQKEAS